MDSINLISLSFVAENPRLDDMQNYRKRKQSRIRRKARGAHGTIELNMTAMLDMAFQLLAFFILTFQPGEIETQVSMRMPNEKPVTQGSGLELELEPPPKMDDFSFPLVVSVHASAEGDAGRITVGTQEFQNAPAEQLYASLNSEIESLVADTGYDRVNLLADEKLRYESLMRVVDVCTKQKLATGEPLTKISISTIQSDFAR
jgi:biopolymer transport protein ExbD